MGDSAMTIAAIFLAAILMFIFPLMTMADKNDDVAQYLSTIISDEIEVKKVEDIHKAFQNDLSNNFKSIMKWNI